jgi:hypothetical protein
MEKIKDFEIESFYQVLRETGIKGVMEWSDVLMLNHLIERGFIPHHREGIIQSLRENTDMDFQSIMDLHRRFVKMRSSLPSYSLSLNNKLDKLNMMYESDVPFEMVGNRMMGLIKEENGYGIYDGLGEHMIKLGSVDKRDYTINWNSNWLLQPEQLRWSVQKVRELKKRIFNEFR